MGRSTCSNSMDARKVLAVAALCLAVALGLGSGIRGPSAAASLWYLSSAPAGVSAAATTRPLGIADRAPKMWAPNGKLSIQRKAMVTSDARITKAIPMMDTVGQDVTQRTGGLQRVMPV